MLYSPCFPNLQFFVPFLIDQFRISTNFNRLWVTFALSGWFEVPLSPVRPSGSVLASRSFAVRDSFYKPSLSKMYPEMLTKCWDSLGFMVTDHLEGRERYSFHISSLYWLIFGLLFVWTFWRGCRTKAEDRGMVHQHASTFTFKKRTD